MKCLVWELFNKSITVVIMVQMKLLIYQESPLEVFTNLSFLLPCCLWLALGWWKGLGLKSLCLSREGVGAQFLCRPFQLVHACKCGKPVDSLASMLRPLWVSLVVLVDPCPVSYGLQVQESRFHEVGKGCAHQCVISTLHGPRDFAEVPLSVYTREKKVGLGIGRTRRSHGPTHQGRPCTGVRHSDTFSVKYLLDFVACAHSHTHALWTRPKTTTPTTPQKQQPNKKRNITQQTTNTTPHHTTQHNHKQTYNHTHHHTNTPHHMVPRHRMMRRRSRTWSISLGVVSQQRLHCTWRTEVNGMGIVTVDHGTGSRWQAHRLWELEKFVLIAVLACTPVPLEHGGLRQPRWRDGRGGVLASVGHWRRYRAIRCLRETLVSQLHVKFVVCSRWRRYLGSYSIGSYGGILSARASAVWARRGDVLSSLCCGLAELLERTKASPHCTDDSLHGWARLTRENGRLFGGHRGIIEGARRWAGWSSHRRRSLRGNAMEMPWKNNSSTHTPAGKCHTWKR